MIKEDRDASLRMTVFSEVWKQVIVPAWITCREIVAQAESVPYGTHQTHDRDVFKTGLPE